MHIVFQGQGHDRIDIFNIKSDMGKSYIAGTGPDFAAIGWGKIFDQLQGVARTMQIGDHHIRFTDTGYALND
ncbi:MAG: hypothetical protein NZ778_02540 [Arenicellales bacterium]|nr:hypothetical protein [Arenicellales bacterium]